MIGPKTRQGRLQASASTLKQAKAARKESRRRRATSLYARGAAAVRCRRIARRRRAVAEASLGHRQAHDGAYSRSGIISNAQFYAAALLVKKCRRNAAFHQYYRVIECNEFYQASS